MLRNAFDFLWISVLVGFALGLIELLIPMLTPARGVISSIVGGFFAGKKHAARAGADLGSAYAWRSSLVMTLVSAVFGAVSLFGLREAGIDILPSGVTLKMLLISWGITIPIFFLIIRLFFGLGVRTVLKAAK